MKQLIYLAGPITGLTYDGAQDWRDAAADILDSDNVETLSPLRGKKFLAGKGVLAATGHDENAISTNKGITRRDMMDTHRATALLVNLLGSTKPSIGTVMELAWAYRAHIPTVVVMEEGNCHEHAMVLEACTYVVRTLVEGISLIQFLCNESTE
jgi:nucleoside 2-deoxyribosyltransferase